MDLRYSTATTDPISSAEVRAVGDHKCRGNMLLVQSCTFLSFDPLHGKLTLHCFISHRFPRIRASGHDCEMHPKEWTCPLKCRPASLYSWTRTRFWCERERSSYLDHRPGHIDDSWHLSTLDPEIPAAHKLECHLNVT